MAPSDRLPFIYGLLTLGAEMISLFVDVVGVMFPAVSDVSPGPEMTSTPEVGTFHIVLRWACGRRATGIIRSREII